MAAPARRVAFAHVEPPEPADPTVVALEERGRTPAQARVRRRFLRRLRLRPGERVLEVGCGTGVVLRDVAVLLGGRGEVVGVDGNRRTLAAARSLLRTRADGIVSLRAADACALPFRGGRFDVALAVTVALHVKDAARMVGELVRVVRPGGRVGLQDQDFGTLAVTHPDPRLTAHLLRGVAERVYVEPQSGRRLPGLLRAAGLDEVRLRTDVYQDTTLAPYTQRFLERRAELGVRFGLVDAPAAQRWLDGFTALVRAGAFVLTLNYYGAVGVKPGRGARA